MKNKIIFIIIIVLVFMILLIPLKGSYAFYSDNKDLNIINTKVGNFKETTIERLIRTSSLNTPKNDTTLEPISDMEEREDTLRRYQGSAEEVTNNYICFGTSDKDKCTKDTDHYMYRIIGYDTVSGELKVIKKEALNKAYPWWSDYDTDVSWPESKIYEAINGDDFLKNESYVPANDKGVNWQDKISFYNYLYGKIYSTSVEVPMQNGSEVYKVESGKMDVFWIDKANANTPDAKSSIITGGKDHIGETVYYVEKKEKWKNYKNSKISLMYISDYLLSIRKDTNCSLVKENYVMCRNGWIHLLENDTLFPAKYEWTISSYGYRIGVDAYFYAYGIQDAGNVNFFYNTSSASIRPVFYISNTIEIIGEGTLENPFVIIN